MSAGDPALGRLVVALRAHGLEGTRVALVLGSGLGSFAGRLQSARRIPFAELDGTRVPVPYLNYYVGNGFVLVPTCGHPADDDMVAIIGAVLLAFPGFVSDVVALPLLLPLQRSLPLLAPLL